jgi:hypothetical protein
MWLSTDCIKIYKTSDAVANALREKWGETDANHQSSPNDSSMVQFLSTILADSFKKLR